MGPIFKIHHLYSVNEKFKKMGILLATWLNIGGENALKQQGWEKSKVLVDRGPGYVSLADRTDRPHWAVVFSLLYLRSG